MSRADDRLQRYFDGELGPRRARRVHEQLQRSADDRRRLQSVRQMRELLQTAADEVASEARFEGLWHRVRQGIAEQPPASSAERLSGWLRRYRLAGGAAVAAVVAAAITVVALSLSTPPPVAGNDCEVESLEVGPQVVSTIFKIEDPGHGGDTTVIWVSDNVANEDR